MTLSALRAFAVLSLFTLILLPNQANAEERIHNFRSDVQIQRDGSLAVIETIDLRAERNLLIAISNCPQECNPCNGWNPTAMRVIVYEAAAAKQEASQPAAGAQGAA